MKQLVFLAALTIPLLISCGSSSSTSSKSTNPHKAAHDQMHTEMMMEEINKETSKLSGEIAGNYEGTVPCNACKGIRIELQLNEDMSYQMKRTYLGTPETEESAEGTYFIGLDWRIDLGENSGGFRYFARNGGALILLDKEGNAFDGTSTENYTLAPIQKKK